MSRFFGSKILKNSSFWCERWHQQVPERLCAHRFKKGLAKCKGCARGKAAVEEEMKALYKEAGTRGGT